MIDADEDWRTLLNNKYLEPEYQALFADQSPSKSKVAGRQSISTAKPAPPQPAAASRKKYDAKTVPSILGLQSGLDKQPGELSLDELYSQYPAIRFPPVQKSPLPDPIVPDTFTFDTSDWDGFARGTSEEAEIMAGVQFIKGIMTNLAVKSSELREVIIEHGIYLQHLTRPAPAEDTEYIKETILFNFETMHEELHELGEEMSIFQPERIHHIFALDEEESPDGTAAVRFEAHSHHSKFQVLEKSIIAIGKSLQDENTLSMLSIIQLKEYALSLVKYPPFPYAATDGIRPNFDKVNRLQNKAKRSERCCEFMVFMLSHHLPVTNGVYLYLQDPSSYGHILIIENHSFANGEFHAIVDYFNLEDDYHHLKEEGVEESHRKSNHRENAQQGVIRSVQGLFIIRSSLNDKDIHYFSSKLLSKMQALRWLNLIDNNLTYSSMASIATAIFEGNDKHKLQRKSYYKKEQNCCSNLQFLHLDHNQINGDGAKMLAHVLPHLQSLVKLSLAFNPIGDRGLYLMLKSMLNKRRGAYLTLPVRPRRVGFAANVESDEEDEESDLDSDISHEDNNENNNDGNDNNNEVKLAIKSQKRYPFTCYFADLFAPPLVHDITTDKLVQKHEELQQQKVAHAIDYHWVRREEDCFEMDEPDAYSDHDEDEDIAFTILEGGAEKVKEEANMTWKQCLQRRERRLLGLPEEEMIIDKTVTLKLLADNYPLFIKKVLRIRIKLIAVSMFLALKAKSRLLTLRGINVRNCQLTSAILPVVAHVLTDITHVIDLDLSGHEKMFVQPKACETLRPLLEKSGVKTLKLNHTGMNDSGLMILYPSLMKSTSLQRFQLDHNLFGPTAANIIGNLTKKFQLESFTILSGGKTSKPAVFSSADRAYYMFQEEAIDILGVEGTSNTASNEDGMLYIKKRRDKAAERAAERSLSVGSTVTLVNEEDSLAPFRDEDNLESEEEDIDEDGMSAIDEGDAEDYDEEKESVDM